MASIQLQGEFRVSAPASKVYAFFLDPVALTDCLDDPHSFHPVDPDHFEGTVTTGISFIRGTFRIRGSYDSKTPPNGLTASLHGSGLGSGVDAALKITLAEANGATTVSWSGDVTLSGPVATLGERMVRGTVDKKVEGLFDNARKKLEAG